MVRPSNVIDATLHTATGLRPRQIQERQLLGAVSQVGVERPPSAIQSQLDEGAVLGRRFLHVQEPLLHRPVGIRREQHLDGELREALEWITRDQHTVRSAVELHGRTDLGGDHCRRADDLDRVAAEARQVVEAPGHDLRRALGGGRRHTQREKGDDRKPSHTASASRARESTRPCCGCRPRSKCPSAPDPGNGEVSVSSPT